MTHHWNWWACAAYLLMWAALVFYFYVRIRCGDSAGYVDGALCHLI